MIDFCAYLCCFVRKYVYGEFNAPQCAVHARKKYEIFNSFQKGFDSVIIIKIVIILRTNVGNNLAVSRFHFNKFILYGIAVK